MRIDELAKKSGLDAKKLGRALRRLPTTHCFREGNFLTLAMVYSVLTVLNKIT